MKSFESKKILTSFLFFIFFFTLLFLKCRADLIQTTLDHDEILTWRIISESLSFTFLNSLSDTQMPLYYILCSLLEGLLGQNFNDYWLRLPSVFFSAVTLTVVFTYSRNFNISVKATLIGILPLIYWRNDFLFLTTYARPYSLILSLIALNITSILTLLFQNNKTTKEKNLNYIFIISLLLLALTHHLFVIYLLSLSIILLTNNKFRSKLIQLFRNNKRVYNSSFLFIIFIYIPCLFYQYTKYSSRISWIKTKSFIDLINSLKEVSHCHSEVTFAMMIIGLSAYFYIGYKNKHNTNHVKFLIKFIVITAFIFLLISNLIVPLITSRYLSILFPLFIIIGIHLMNLILENINKATYWIILTYFFQYLSQHNFELIYPQIKSERMDYKLNIKKFLREIPEVVSREDKELLCVTLSDYSVQFEEEESSNLSAYSKMIFKKNICNRTITHTPTNKEYNEYNYILFYGSKTTTPKDIDNLNLIIKETAATTEYLHLYEHKNRQLIHTNLPTKDSYY